MAVAPTLGVAIALGIAGVATLRFAWSRLRRSVASNMIGWGLLTLSTVIAAKDAGAWGIAVAALAAMLTAFAILAVAGLQSPAREARASTRGVGMLPVAGQPRRIGRRLGTFFLTMVMGFAVAVGLALAIIWLGGRLGWSAANTNVIALFSVPLTWGMLLFALLMQESRRVQLVILLACCLPIIPALLSGSIK